MFSWRIPLVTASPNPIPAPEPVPNPAPIPPGLQPIVAAKNNLAGTAAVRNDLFPYSDDSWSLYQYDNPKFNSTLYSNGIPKSHIPLTYITAASLVSGTILVSLVWYNIRSQSIEDNR